MEIGARRALFSCLTFYYYPLSLDYFAYHAIIIAICPYRQHRDTPGEPTEALHAGAYHDQDQLWPHRLARSRVRPGSPDELRQRRHPRLKRRDAALGRRRIHRGLSDHGAFAGRLGAPRRVRSKAAGSCRQGHAPQCAQSIVRPRGHGAVPQVGRHGLTHRGRRAPLAPPATAGLPARHQRSGQRLPQRGARSSPVR
jgi:hypothetical protein